MSRSITTTKVQVTGREKSFTNGLFDRDDLMYCLRGSHAHNLYISPDEDMGTDDYDTMSVYQYTDKYYLSLPGYHHSKESEQTMEGETDHVGYEVRKMFHMLKGINPNVITVLFTRPQDYIIITPKWQIVIDNRDIFAGKDAIKNAFGGYAYAQFNRMMLGQERGYRGRLGAKRKELLGQVGYDPKNASHLIRLLKMGIEYLRDGEPKVWRTDDREELISIKRGEWELDRVKEYARKLFDELEKAHQVSKLPATNQAEKIDELLYTVMTY